MSELNVSEQRVRGVLFQKIGRALGSEFTKLLFSPTCGPRQAVDPALMGLGWKRRGGVLWLLVFSKERIQSTDAEIEVRLTWRVLPFGF